MSVLLVGVAIFAFGDRLRPATRIPEVALDKPIPKVAQGSTVRVLGSLTNGEFVEAWVDGRLAGRSASLGAERFEIQVDVPIGTHRIRLVEIENASGEVSETTETVVRHSPFPSPPLILEVRPENADDVGYVALKSEPYSRIEIKGAVELGLEDAPTSEWVSALALADGNGRSTLALRLTDPSQSKIQFRTVNSLGTKSSPGLRTDIRHPVTPPDANGAVKGGVANVRVVYTISPDSITEHIEVDVPADRLAVSELIGRSPFELIDPSRSEFDVAAFAFPGSAFLDDVLPDLSLGRTPQAACGRYESSSQPAVGGTLTIADGGAHYKIDREVYLASTPGSIDPNSALVVCAPQGFPELGDRGLIELRIRGFAPTNVSLTPVSVARDADESVLAFDGLEPMQQVRVELNRGAASVIAGLFAPAWPLFPIPAQLISVLFLAIFALPKVAAVGAFVWCARRLDDGRQVAAAKNLGIWLIAIYVIAIAFTLLVPALPGWVGASFLDQGPIFPALAIVGGMSIVAALIFGSAARLRSFLPSMSVVRPRTLFIPVLLVALLAVLPTGPFAPYAEVRDPLNLLNAASNAVWRLVPFINAIFEVALLVVGSWLAVAASTASEAARPRSERALRIIGGLLLVIFVVGAGGYLLGLPLSIVLAGALYWWWLLVPVGNRTQLPDVAAFVRLHRADLLRRVLGRRASAKGAQATTVPHRVRSLNAVMAFASGNPASDVWFGVKAALLAVAPLLVIYVADLVSRASIFTSPYYWQDSIIDAASFATSWLIYGGFFGLMFDRIRGRTGLRKAVAVGVVIVVCQVPFILARVVAGTSPVWSALFTTLQIAVVTTTVGIAFDIRVLQQALPRSWREASGIAKDLAVLSGDRYIVGFLSTVVTAIGVTVGAFLTGQLALLLGALVSSVLPNLPK